MLHVTPTNNHRGVVWGRLDVEVRLGNLVGVVVQWKTRGNRKTYLCRGRMCSYQLLHICDDRPKENGVKIKPIGTGYRLEVQSRTLILDRGEVGCPQRVRAREVGRIAGRKRG